MAPIIKVENLSKQYRIGEHREPYGSLRESLVRAAKAPFKRFRNGHSQNNAIWALKDVSFEVMPGEVVGVIGRNGAGKSTLLKILSRITEPTSGGVDLHGRVGSLLEVGTGFHAELTGRENIYLNGAILGMKKVEIDKKFDEIVAFAEIEKFLDTPVKYYSSGMYVRLAFAVAAHLEPEILLVDEVLAVGDAEFQEKCIGKMGNVAKNGKTVLFVSHNMQVISALTQRSILISQGHCIYDGKTSAAISSYLGEHEVTELIYTDPPSPSEPRITRVELITSEPMNVQSSEMPMDVLFEITTPSSVRGASLSFQARNNLNQPVVHLWTFDSERPMCRQAGKFYVKCHIPRLHLYMGNYDLTIYFSERAGGKLFQVIEGVCPFEVVMYGRYREFEWRPGDCIYLEEAEWHVERIPEKDCGFGSQSV